MHLFEHLEGALDEAGLLPPAREEARTWCWRCARCCSARGLTDQEVRTLRGAIAALERRPTRPRTLPDGSGDERAGAADDRVAGLTKPRRRAL